ncbi:MAG: ArnT family glycosyltransferase [Gammaproteobacteria bacterium]
MANDARRDRRGETWPFLALLAVAAGLLFAGAAGRELHGTPTFYASLIREMVDAGDPLVVFRGDEAYLLKPPLVLWLGMLAAEVVGLGNLAVTFFPRLAAVLCVALTAALVGRLAGARAGLVAGFVLLTNSTFIQFSTTLRMDSTLLCGLLLVVWGWFALPSARASAAVFGGITIGLLSKGPLVLVALPLCVLGALLLRERAPAARVAALDWRWAVLLAPALAWYAWVFATHGTQQLSDLGQDLVRPDTNTTASAWQTYAHEYLLRPFERYWPWLPCMLAGLLFAWLPGGGIPAQRRPALRWFALWTFAVYAMCAAKPDRDIRYLYVALPALAGLAAIPLAAWLGDRGERWWLRLLAVLAIGVPLAAGSGLGTRDTRATVSAMVDGLAAAAPALAGRAPVVIGDYPLQPGKPRRQLNQRDWAHFYLGVVPRIVPWSAVESGALAGEPLVFTIRAGDYAARLAAAGFEPREVSKEMVMAVPR